MREQDKKFRKPERGVEGAKGVIAGAAAGSAQPQFSCLGVVEGVCALLGTRGGEVSAFDFRAGPGGAAGEGARARAHGGAVLAAAGCPAPGGRPGSLVVAVSHERLTVHEYFRDTDLLRLSAVHEGLGLAPGLEPAGCRLALSPCRGFVSLATSGGQLRVFAVAPSENGSPEPAAEEPEAEEPGEPEAAAGGEGGQPNGAYTVAQVLGVDAGAAAALVARPTEAAGGCHCHWQLKGHSLGTALQVGGLYAWWEGLGSLYMFSVRKRQAAGSGGGEVKPVKTWVLPSDVRCSAVSTNGIILALGLEMGATYLLDTHLGAQYDLVYCDGAPILALEFADKTPGAAGKLLFGTAKGALWSYNVHTHRKVHKALVKYTRIAFIKHLPGSNHVLVGSEGEFETRLQLCTADCKVVSELLPATDRRQLSLHRDHVVHHEKDGLVLVPTTSMGGGEAPAAPEAPDGAHQEAAGAESQEVREQEQAEVPEGGEDAPSTQGSPTPAEVVVERFLTKVKSGVQIADGPPERGREVATGGRAKSNQFQGGKRRTRVRAAHRSIFTGQGSILAPSLLPVAPGGPDGAAPEVKSTRHTLFAAKGNMQSIMELTKGQEALGVPEPAEPKIKIPTSNSSLLWDPTSRYKRMRRRQQELIKVLLYESTTKPCMT